MHAIEQARANNADNQPVFPHRAFARIKLVLVEGIVHFLICYAHSGTEGTAPV
jgi:hypothetical protein